MKEIPEDATKEKSVRLILEQLKWSIKRPENACRKKDFQNVIPLHGLFHYNNVKESFICLDYHTVKP